MSTETKARNKDYQPILADPVITLVGKSGAMYRFNLYRQAFVKGLFSPCKRVRVYKHRDSDGDIVPNQYAVEYKGVEVPSGRYTIKYAKKSGFRTGARN